MARDKKQIIDKIKTLVNSIASSNSSLQLHISNNSSTFCRALNSLNNNKINKTNKTLTIKNKAFLHERDDNNIIKKYC